MSRFRDNLLIVFWLAWAGGPVYSKTLDICFSPKGHCEQVFVSWVDAAEHSLDGAIYNLTEPRITDAFIRAQKRGLAVRLVKNDSESLTEGAAIKRLREAGVTVKLQKGSGGGLQHHKFLVIDRQYVITGSFNWTRAAAGRNDENFVVLDDAAPKFIQEFERLWKK